MTSQARSPHVTGTHVIPGVFVGHGRRRVLVQDGVVGGRGTGVAGRGFATQRLWRPCAQAHAGLVRPTAAGPQAAGAGAHVLPGLRSVVLTTWLNKGCVRGIKFRLKNSSCSFGPAWEGVKKICHGCTLDSIEDSAAPVLL